MRPTGFLQSPGRRGRDAFSLDCRVAPVVRIPANLAALFISRWASHFGLRLSPFDRDSQSAASRSPAWIMRAVIHINARLQDARRIAKGAGRFCDVP